MLARVINFEDYVNEKNGYMDFDKLNDELERLKEELKQEKEKNNELKEENKILKRKNKIKNVIIGTTASIALVSTISTVVLYCKNKACLLRLNEFESLVEKLSGVNLKHIIGTKLVCLKGAEKLSVRDVGLFCDTVNILTKLKK